MGLIRNLIDDNKFTPADIPTFESKFFYEGAIRRIDLERFAIGLKYQSFISRLADINN